MLTSKELEESGGQPLVSGGDDTSRRRRPRRRYVHIRFVGNAYPHKTHFDIAWLELVHVTQNQDGVLRASRRTASMDGGVGVGDDCAFRCPGDGLLCLPARSVCDGVIDCPGGPDDESPAACYNSWNFRFAGGAVSGHELSAVTLFVAVAAAIVVFGAAVFAASAYRRRLRSLSAASRCRATTECRSFDRILYSTVIYHTNTFCVQDSFR